MAFVDEEAQANPYLLFGQQFNCRLLLLSQDGCFGYCLSVADVGKEPDLAVDANIAAGERQMYDMVFVFAPFVEAHNNVESLIQRAGLNANFAHGPIPVLRHDAQPVWCLWRIPVELVRFKEREEII